MIGNNTPYFFCSGMPPCQRRVLGVRRGFTFMEMIVVVTIFSILMMATSDIFMRAQRTQRKTAALQRLQDDTRFLTQKITSELQAGSIDYANALYTNAQSCDVAAPSAITPVDGNAVLVLRRFDGSRLYVKKDDTAGVCVDETSTPCLAMSDDNATWSSASSKGVKVESLTFYISPDKDPFTFCDASATYLRDTQPRVTIALRASATVTGSKEPVVLSVQTTISSREYKR
ncbi:MAG: type II secretion system protein [Patescibacteria group bacterium]